MLSQPVDGRDFYPIDYLPRGVRLTAYGGDASDLPADVCSASSTPSPPAALRCRSHRTYRLDEIADAHTTWKHGHATGKLVVLP